VETFFTPSVADMIAAILDRFGPNNGVSVGQTSLVPRNALTF
jgi:hypothetical protein